MELFEGDCRSKPTAAALCRGKLCRCNCWWGHWRDRSSWHPGVPAGCRALVMAFLWVQGPQKADRGPGVLHCDRSSVLRYLRSLIDCKSCRWTGEPQPTRSRQTNHHVTLQKTASIMLWSCAFSPSASSCGAHRKPHSLSAASQILRASAISMHRCAHMLNIP